MIRRFAQVIGATSATLLLVVLAADPAAAHVTVSPGEVPGGGFAKISFRVPSEREDARTVRIQVTLPTEPVLTSVRIKRTLGWDYKVEKADLDPPIQNGSQVITQVIRKITWTAHSRADGMLPTEFIDFDVNLGRLPASGQIAFPTLQKYSDGEIVSWTDPIVPGQPAPAHPAPVLKLVPPAAVPAAAAPAAEPAVKLVVAKTATAPASTDSRVPVVAGLLGLVLTVGVIGRLFSMRRTRRSADS
ncbi:MAG TPA: YcnI family protein [Actinoplanes sp.]|nr:YcnI family protein [Actinoplanes sp.]